jgi:Cyclic nucleotide-binding domain
MMVSNSGTERILAFLGRGAIVGELSIIDGLPRSMSVVAVRDAALSFLSRAAFEAFAENIPSSANRCSGFSLNACARETRLWQPLASLWPALHART